jgi:hypothetical protein
MNGAVLFRWTSAIPGREAASIEVFGRAVARFEDLTKQGRIHGHREYFSITGQTNGFMILEGDVAELLKIVAEEDTIRLNGQAAAIANDFTVEVYGGGTDQATQQLLGTYTSGLHDLGYM